MKLKRMQHFKMQQTSSVLQHVLLRGDQGPPMAAEPMMMMTFYSVEEYVSQLVEFNVQLHFPQKKMTFSC